MSASAAAALPASMPTEPSARLREIYRLHHEFVWRHLLRLGVAEATVDEAIQDVFLTVHRRHSDFDGRTDLRGWIYGITRRVAANHRRKTARREVAPLVEMTATGPMPDEALARLEAAKRVETFLDKLPDDQREVFLAVDVDGMSAPEVADAIGVSVNTVYSRLRLARRRFEAEAARLATRERRERSARGGQHG